MIEMNKIGLLSPGTKFIVLDNPKEGAFPPGTIGFMGPLLGHDPRKPLTCSAEAIIVRRGKTGKDRLDFCNMSLPTFFNSELQENEKYLKILPLGAKYYVHIKPMPTENSLMSMSEIDLAGWSAAYCKHIQTLIGYSSHGYNWPEDKSDPMNISNHLRQRWDNDPAALIQLYSSPEFKENLVTTLRRAETSLIRCNVSHQFRIGQIIREAAKTMMAFCKEYGDDLFDLDFIRKIITFIDSMEENNKPLEKLKMTKGWGSHV